MPDPATTTTSPTTFADLDLSPALLSALTSLGYEEPTPVQRESVPPLLAGRDVLGQAATGTGKTAAFALPLLQRLFPGGERGEKKPGALVLAPTRELAMQVSEAVHKYGKGLAQGRGARVLPVYGGTPVYRQLRSLESGVDVVVGTPGRVRDLLERGALSFAALEVVVLDEADEMLDMGFHDELEAILKQAPKQRQTVLFSATMPSRIEGMARSHLNSPVRVQIQREEAPEGEAPRVRQTAYVVARAHRAAALGRVLDVEQPTAALVFCRTREEVDTLSETLNGRGYRAEALHGGMTQDQRDKVLGRLRSGSSELLVATDVAARGLDLDLLTHVVNVNVPSSPETYVHRIGRVGRAGREGVAITLAEPRERRMLSVIERTTGQRIEVGRVPTVEDVKSLRLAQTREAVVEALAGDDLDAFRDLVRELASEEGGEHDPVDVAAAAVKLLREATGTPVDEEDIPEPVRPVRDAGREAPRGDRPDRGPRVDRAERAPAKRPARLQGVEMAKLFIGAGKNAGMRPQDLVGAIAGESSLTGKDIGIIEITERFSLVEVPERAADEVVQALKGAVIRGGKPTVRRERKTGS